MDIAAWLRGLGLERYEQAFAGNEIDADILPKLTVEDLTALGVTSVGHRRKLLDAIATLRQREQPPLPHQTHSATPAAEHRQVTVLFADLTGYTQLTDELGAEAAHKLLGLYFAIVDGVIGEYGGTVDKHIGDCVMAVFGAPIAHGNDPQRAVRSALDIRDHVPALSADFRRPISVHIGVASGQVVASGTGSDTHHEYTVTGSSVNLASRLASAAGPGEILISDALYEELGDRLTCEAAGRLDLKGMTEKVMAWRLRAMDDSAAPQRQRPIVGRQGELQQISSILANCRETGSGHAVYVRGEAGIGKSRLIEELQASATDLGIQCHCAYIVDFGASSTLDAIGAVAHGLLAASAGNAALTVDAERAARLAIAKGFVADHQQAHLYGLLGLQQPAELRELYDAMDTASRNQGKRETLAELIAQASDRQPQLLVFEDLHWADRPILDDLAACADAVAEHPVALLMTSRFEGDPLDRAWRTRAGTTRFTTIDLSPLRQADARQLADAYPDVGAGVAETCIARSGGNPLFLEHLLRHAGEGEAAVPGSIQNLVQSRMDQLTTSDKEAIQAASVLGQRFDLNALAAMVQSQERLGRALEEHMLIRNQGDRLVFTHALIRDAVYQSLLSDRRAELHRLASAWFENRDVVLHAEHLDRAGDAGASAAYLKAARAQANEFRPERALGLVERGIELTHSHDDMHALKCLHGDLLRDLGEIDRSISMYQDALDVAENDLERCHAWIGLARAMRIADRLDEALAALDNAEAAASRQDDMELQKSTIHHLRGNIYFPRGEIEECAEQHELALRYARCAGSVLAEVRALSGLGDAAVAQGRMMTAQQKFVECVNLCRNHGLRRAEPPNVLMMGFTREFAFAPRESLVSLLEAVDVAQRVQHLRAEFLARANAGLVSYELAEFEEGLSQLQMAHELIERIGAKRFLPEYLLFSAKILRAQGHEDDAAKRLERAKAVCRETGMAFVGPRVLAEIAVGARDMGERKAALEEGQAILEAGSVGHSHLWFYRDAIEASLMSEDWPAAMLFADALESYTRSEPLPWSDFFIARGRALAAFGQGSRGKAMLQQLMDRLKQAEAAHMHVAKQALQKALNDAAEEPTAA